MNERKNRIPTGYVVSTLYHAAKACICSTVFQVSIGGKVVLIMLVFNCISVVFAFVFYSDVKGTELISYNCVCSLTSRSSDSSLSDKALHWGI